MYFSFSNLVVEQVLYNVLYQKATPFIINASSEQNVSRVSVSVGNQNSKQFIVGTHGALVTRCCKKASSWKWNYLGRYMYVLHD